jgi:hypothetical protein
VTLDKNDVADIARQIVKEELSALLRDVEIVPWQRGKKRSGVHSVKKTFTIPEDVWDEVRALGGIMSSHVTAALRVYLNMKKKVRE